MSEREIIDKAGRLYKQGVVTHYTELPNHLPVTTDEAKRIEHGLLDVGVIDPEPGAARSE